jgi:hypothetical protein
MRIRHLITLALLASAPSVASAQFTTFIPPKAKLVDSVKAAVAAEQKAQTDTATAARVTNMKTWVDSAAGIIPTSVADSLAQDTMMDTLTSRGTRAPATASPLALFATGGAAMLIVGLLLLRRPRPARDRA